MNVPLFSFTFLLISHLSMDGKICNLFYVGINVTSKQIIGPIYHLKAKLFNKTPIIYFFYLIQCELSKLNNRRDDSLTSDNDEVGCPVLWHIHHMINIMFILYWQDVVDICKKTFWKCSKSRWVIEYCQEAEQSKLIRKIHISFTKSVFF